MAGICPARRAPAEQPRSSAKTAPGPISSAIARIRAWSWLWSEYAMLTGTTGMPAVIAPSEITRWFSRSPTARAAAGPTPSPRPAAPGRPSQPPPPFRRRSGTANRPSGPALSDQRVVRIRRRPGPHAVHHGHRVRPASGSVERMSRLPSSAPGSSALAAPAWAATSATMLGAANSGAVIPVSMTIHPALRHPSADHRRRLRHASRIFDKNIKTRHLFVALVPGGPQA